MVTQEEDSLEIAQDLGMGEILDRFKNAESTAGRVELDLEWASLNLAMLCFMTLGKAFLTTKIKLAKPQCKMLLKNTILVKVVVLI